MKSQDYIIVLEIVKGPEFLLPRGRDENTFFAQVLLSLGWGLGPFSLCHLENSLLLVLSLGCLGDCPLGTGAVGVLGARLLPFPGVCEGHQVPAVSLLSDQ